MPKRSQESTQKLSRKAIELLEKGHTQAEVADKLGVSTRTIQRWVRHYEYQKPNQTPEARAQDALVEVAYQSEAMKVKEVSPLQDLMDYHQSQKWLAQQHGDVALLLLPKLKRALEVLDPVEITSRQLPYIYKMIIDATNSSNDCFTRATGLEEVLNAFQEHIDRNRHEEDS